MVNEDFSISKAGIKEFKTISYFTWHLVEITYLILMTLTIIVTNLL
jgi:hypothetical protein